MALSLSWLGSGSSSESCVASSPGDRSNDPTGTTSNELSDEQWLEEKRGNFVRLLRDLGDARLVTWADRAESATLAAFLAFMRLENSDVAGAATPEEAAEAALRAVDRAVLLLEADPQELKAAARKKLGRYIELFSSH